MALSKTLRKVGQGLSGVFLGLTGSWLLVICVGGLLTLGVLSLFQLGILLSVGCIGICFLVAGVCWLYDALAKNTPDDLTEEPASGWLFQAERLKKSKTPDPTFDAKSYAHRENSRMEMPEAKPSTSDKRSYNPFN